MSNTEHIWFNTLKKEIAETFRKTHPSCTLPIEEWKGQDITNFQEELMQKVRGRISEKWFYTHMKSQGEKLPRIDMLNMLCAYAGYEDWRDFTNKQPDFTNKIEEERPVSFQQVPMDTPEEVKSELIQAGKSKSGRGIFIGGSILIIGILGFLMLRETTKNYHACLTDLNGQALIPNSKIEIHLIKKDESPVSIPFDKNACFEIKGSETKIQFAIHSPYYRTDTITRNLITSYTQEEIKLRTNDYALMIHYFSTSNIRDWKQHRTKLNDMIIADAKIFQVYKDGRGMELFNKEEFINKLTMPLKSLRNIEVIETRYSGNQISLLRFIQTEQSK